MQISLKILSRTFTGAVFFLSLLGSTTYATSVVQNSLQDLTMNSDEIFEGVIVSHEFVQLNGQAFTAFHSQVRDQIKTSKSVGEEVVFYLPGGESEDGKIKYSLAGYEKALIDGSTYIFFLSKMIDGRLQPTHWQIKKVEVAEDGKRYVVSRGDSVDLHRAGEHRHDDRALSFENRDESAPQEVSDFKTQIFRNLQ